MGAGEAWVPANAGTHAEPLYIYKYSLLKGDRDLARGFFSLGLSIGFSELEFLG